MEIQNTGNTILSISNITSSNPAFIIEPDITFPITLFSLGSKTVDVVPTH
jgi:hypothetical protein